MEINIFFCNFKIFYDDKINKYRQIDGQTDRHTYIQTDMHTHNQTSSLVEVSYESGRMQDSLNCNISQASSVVKCIQAANLLSQCKCMWSGVLWHSQSVVKLASQP